MSDEQRLGLPEETSLERALATRQSRRGFLRVAGMASAGLAATGLLAACGGGDGDDADSGTGDSGSGSGDSGSGSTGSGDTTPSTGGGDSGSSGEPKSGGELVVGLATDPEVLDPHKTTLRVAQHPNMLIFAMLVIQDRDQTFKPYVAESWEISEDGLELTFSLKDGVKFHDGSPLNAEAVKFNFDRLIDPETKSPVALSSVGPLQATEVVDDLTVKMIFERPYAPILINLVGTSCGIVSKEAVEKFGDDFAQNPVGAGPFVFKEYVAKSHITLERNPDFDWAPDIFDHSGPALLDRITFKIIPETASRMATLETGEIDVAERIAEDDVEFLQDNPDIEVVVVPAPGLGDLFLINTQAPITEELAVRKALNLGIDRETIAEALFAGLTKPLYSPLRPNVIGYWEGAKEAGYGYDPELAKQILDEAGWVPGPDGIREKDGQRLSLNVPTGPWAIGRQYAEIAKDQYAELGIEIKLSQLEQAAIDAVTEAGEHHITATRWTSADPNILHTLFHSSQIGIGGNNDSRVSDPKVDELLDKGQQTVDPDARRPFYEEVQKILIEQAVSVPLLQPNEIYAHRTRVKNFEVDPRSYMWLYPVWVED